MKQNIPKLFQRSNIIKNNNENLNLLKIPNPFVQIQSKSETEKFNKIFSNIFKNHQQQQQLSNSNNKLSFESKIPKSINYDQFLNKSTDHLLLQKNLLIAIKPSLEFIESIPNNFKLLKYLNEIIDKFDNQLDKSNKNLNEIVLQSSNSPSLPILDQSTFPLIIKHGLIQFIKFKSPLEAITIFESLKNKSIETFIFGCNIINYNELININWLSFKDLNKILQILDELKLNGIQGNFQTLTKLLKISKEFKTLLFKDNELDELNLLSTNDYYFWSERNQADLKQLDQYIQDLKTYLR
ncbi:hypothetical protein WICMUC_000926 [Wickerhamomyces mucosus]|uniref:Mtf2-like C-terminal domain-containing protein n=1 Tax=Wickerhamomyces mucosus TaxID=1378264 RepID=A0A9P8PW83_9ASCO|nr:hypothetical protein WICMUC_000926 [Wickerhamomyces mucosus]